VAVGPLFPEVGIVESVQQFLQFLRNFVVPFARLIDDVV
jgi:hypothetical protein